MSDLSFIILARNPRTRTLIPVVNDDGETIAEFSSETKAIEAAADTTICKAWSYEIVEVSGP